MDSTVVLQGVIVGLILAVPVGPLSLMCIRRSLADGRLHGIVSGFGVAAADTFYAVVAFLGLTAISGVILSFQDIFRFCAGLVLLIVGIRIFFTLPGPDTGRGLPGTYAKDFLSMAAIAIVNPMTIIFLMVTLPGFGIAFGGNSLVSAAEFVGGFFLGSVAWWVCLCGSLGTVRSRISQKNLVLINRISGIFIACIGAFMLLSPALS